MCKSEAEIEKWTKEHSVSLHARRSYVAYEDVEPTEGPMKFITEEIAAVDNYDFIQSKNIFSCTLFNSNAMKCCSIDWTAPYWMGG